MPPARGKKSTVPSAYPPGAAADGLSPGGLAADERDRDVSHRGVSFGAMPMPFAGLDLHDIANVDFAPLVLGRRDAAAVGHDQHLIAVMRVPAGVAALAKVHDAAIEVGGLARFDDGLARAEDRTGIAVGAFGGAFGRDDRDVFE